MSVNDIQLYLFCLLGIFISIVLPGLWAYVRQFFPAGGAGQPHSLPVELLQAIKPYAALGAASALTAILLFYFLRDTITDPRAALLAGYAWDSTLQKLK